MYTHVIWGFSIRAQYHTTCRLHETRVNRKMPLSRDMLFSTFKENNYFLKEEGKGVVHVSVHKYLLIGGLHVFIIVVLILVLLF